MRCPGGGWRLTGVARSSLAQVSRRAFAQRSSNGPGCSPLVSSLYYFWEHRLQHKFNRTMYVDFKSLAVEDKLAGYAEGLEALFRFYRGSLQQLFREKVFQDFAYLVAIHGQNPQCNGMDCLLSYLQHRSSATEPTKTAVRRILAHYPWLHASVMQAHRV